MSVHGRAHSPTFTVTSSTSQLILQHFRRFTQVTAHCPTLPFLHLRHSSISNPSFASPTLQARHLIHLASRPWFFHTQAPILLSCSKVLPDTSHILQSFLHFAYVTAHSPTLSSLYLRHSSFSNPSVSSPTSHLILQPFFLLRHRRFTYVTWRAAHVLYRTRGWRFYVSRSEGRGNVNFSIVYSHFNYMVVS